MRDDKICFSSVHHTDHILHPPVFVPGTLETRRQRMGGGEEGNIRYTRDNQLRDRNTCVNLVLR